MTTMAAGPAQAWYPSEIYLGTFVPRVSVDQQKAQVLAGINAERSQRGLKPLTLNAELGDVAQRWSTNVSASGDCEHNPDLANIASRLQTAALTHETMSCIAAGSGGSDGMHPVRSWMISPAHRDIMLHPAVDAFGIGVATAKVFDKNINAENYITYYIANYGVAKAPVPPAPPAPVGYTRVTANGATYVLANSAYAKYRSRPDLGDPTGDTVAVSGGGTVTTFRAGSIYTSAAGVYVVRGAIADRWRPSGGEGGRLGYPVSDEFSVRGGMVQRFQGGLVYWGPSTGAHVVLGAIEHRYGSLGWEASFLGLPTSSEFGPLRDSGFGQRFQGGIVYWSPATGARAVRGAILDAYGKLGFEAGRLG